MKKLSIMILLLAILVSIPIVAQEEASCDIDAPAENTEVNMIGWSFAITDFLC